MSRARSCVLLALIAVLAQAETSCVESTATLRIQAAPFGTITVYKPARIDPDSVVLLVSGDNGWTPRIGNIARALVGKGAC